MNEHPHPFAPHPWQGAYDDFNAHTLPLLLEHGRAISAEQSDESREMIRLYGMLHRSFDPMTASMLRDLVDAWVVLNITNKKEPNT